jgi:hypothetical protein
MSELTMYLIALPAAVLIFVLGFLFWHDVLDKR